MAATKQKDEIVLNPQDNLDSVLTEWQEQASKLKPYVDAYTQYTTLIESFTAIKEGKVPPTARQATARRTPSGERAGRGDRPAQMLAVVQQAGEEGVTVSEIAERLDMESNYLYRIRAKLEKDGEIVTRNRRLFIATNADKAEAKDDDNSEGDGAEE